MRPRPRSGDRPRESVVEALRRIQEERRALGIPGRTREEIDAQINALRDECEDRLAELAQVQDQAQQEREKRGC